MVVLHTATRTALLMRWLARGPGGPYWGEGRLVLEHRVESVELGKAGALAKRKVREAAGKLPAQSPVALATAAGGTLSQNA